MYRMNIDICAASCTGACSHCVHGRARPAEGTVSFPDTLVATYQRLEDYGRATGLDTRVSLMDPLATLPDASFLKETQVLSLCVSGFAGLIGSPAALIQRVNKICESLRCTYLELQVTPPFELAELTDPDTIGTLITLQRALVRMGPTTSVYIGINQNKSAIPWEDVQQEAWTLLFLLNGAWRKLDPARKRLEKGDVRRQRGRVDFSHEVWDGDLRMAMGGRFFDPGDDTEGVRDLDAALPKPYSDLSLGLFQWGVHVNHSTLNIGDPTLRFKYGEFGDLLTTAEDSGTPLKFVIFEAVRARRA